MGVALCALAVWGSPALTARASAGAPPGTVEEFPVTTIYEGSMGEIVRGPDGTMWILQSSEFPIGAFTGTIQKITTSGTLTDFFGLPRGILPAEIARGSDGNMWYTDSLIGLRPGTVGRVTTAGEVVEFPIPNIAPSPIPELTARSYGIALGSDGNMWFAYDGVIEADKTFIGRITTAGKVIEFPIPTGWRLNLPGFSSPVSLALGSDGNIWFTDVGKNLEGENLIGRITPAGVITEFPVPTLNSYPTGIALGSDGNTWFAETGVGKIGRITPAGVITEFTVPGIGHSLTLGPDGNIWFTGRSGVNPIGWITPAGTVRSLPAAVIGSASPASIAAGPDGNIWFTDPRVSSAHAGSTSFIGRIITPYVPVNTESPAVSGNAREGQVLSVSKGTWANDPSAFAYQWERCDAAGLNCENINGGTEAKYFIEASDVGHTLRAMVIASNVGGAASAVAAPSPAVRASSPPPAVPVPLLPPPSARLPVVGATVTWRFRWSRTYTLVRSLVVHGLPAGGFVDIACRGRGCAFVHTRLASTAGRRPCHGHGCVTRHPLGLPGEISLTKLFKARHLKPGAHITVSVVKAGWVGKSFSFAARKGQTPSVQVTCLEPGSTSTGGPC
jgi:streptogramin lyase